MVGWRSGGRQRGPMCLTSHLPSHQAHRTTLPPSWPPTHHYNRTPYHMLLFAVLRSWWWANICPKHVELIFKINKYYYLLRLIGLDFIALPTLKMHGQTHIFFPWFIPGESFLLIILLIAQKIDLSVWFSKFFFMKFFKYCFSSSSSKRLSGCSKERDINLNKSLVKTLKRRWDKRWVGE
jgi:hypothetical protein